MNCRCIVAALVFGGACDKSHAESHVERHVEPTGAAAMDASVAVAPTPPSPTGGNPTVRTRSAWRGSYKSAAGALYVPPDWKNVHWNVKDDGAGIGEGIIALHIDPLSGRVLGTVEGPLGPAVLEGLAADGKLTASIARKDPADQGFKGTLVGAIADDHAEGTMNVSPAEANAIRTATFMLVPDGERPVAR
ncbi:MAG: hypothetical protein M3O46_17985 [Myxococcota bacterium]|nr:hypothetical protein [Myxococcota bacterium]